MEKQNLETGAPDVEEAAVAGQPALPLPTPHFRRRAWVAFQRALDPLSPPRPMPPPRA